MFPLALFERIVFYLPISKTTVINPVFIIGHWRSGTTYLHYLLSQDKSFYAPTNLDAFVPEVNILGGALAKKILHHRLPQTRPMDDVELHPDLPQEEEFAIANLSPYSFYHALTFPDHFRKLFNQFVLLRNSSEKKLLRWEKVYTTYLKKIQYKAGKKRLLLKNPVNTARIQTLLKLYPDAKFIYLHRDPTEVKHSTFRMFHALIKINTLQPFDTAQLKKDITTCYTEMMEVYENQRTILTPENLIELSYQDLLANPAHVVASIYSQFQWKGLEANQSNFERFIENQKDYKPHLYTETIVN